MQKTYSASPLERIAYFGHGDGEKADVYLRENIEEVVVPLGDGTTTQWCADEVHIETTLSEEEVEENFDALWVRAETNAKSPMERIEEMEELMGVLIDEVLGVA